ncbi:MAG: hypothetical protein ACREHD_25750, partial [Pirellulales bacterium]
MSRQMKTNTTCLRKRMRRARTATSLKGWRGVEHLEPRALLDANAFLQGFAYAGGAPLPGAQIDLLASDGTTLLATTIAGADGSYRFDSNTTDVNNQPLDLVAGTYVLKNESLAGYSPDGVVANSVISPTSNATNDSIQVTLIDPTSLEGTFNNDTYTALGRWENLTAGEATIATNSGPYSLIGSAGQIPLTVSGTGLSSVNIYSFCTNPFQDLDTGVNIYHVTPEEGDPASNPVPTYNAGRIAYLYNHDGITLTTDADHALALQVAIWELEYDPDLTPDVTQTDLTTGNFKFNDPSNPNIATLANAYIADSYGKSEDAAFLDATGSPIQGGMQSMIATDSINFNNTLSPPGPVSS